MSLYGMKTRSGRKYLRALLARPDRKASQPKFEVLAPFEVDRIVIAKNATMPRGMARRPTIRHDWLLTLPKSCTTLRMREQREAP